MRSRPAQLSSGPVVRWSRHIAPNGLSSTICAFTQTVICHNQCNPVTLERWFTLQESVFFKKNPLFVLILMETSLEILDSP